MHELFVGLDISKDTIDGSVRPSNAHWQLAQTEADWATLVVRLQAETPTLIVVEATGGYERGVVSALARAGLPVAVVNPRRVRDFAKASQHLAKTDRSDAAVLAHFAQTFQPRPMATPDAQQEQLPGGSAPRGRALLLACPVHARSLAGVMGPSTCPSRSPLGNHERDQSRPYTDFSCSHPYPRATVVSPKGASTSGGETTSTPSAS